MKTPLPALKRILTAADGGHLPKPADIEALRAFVSAQPGRPPNKHLDPRYVGAVAYVLGLVKDGAFKTEAQAMAWADGRVGLSYGSLKRYMGKRAYRRMAQYMLAEDAVPTPGWAGAPIPPKEDFA